MPNFRMTSAALPGVYTKRYSAFRGVDFSSDPSQVDDSRSPNAINIVADAAGCPQKRPGWRKLGEVEAPVRGIHRLECGEVSEFIVHAGSKLYRWQGGEDAPVQILDGLTGEHSSGFMHNDRLYILTGAEYIYATDTAAGYIEDVAYAPITALHAGVEESLNTSGTMLPMGFEVYEEANIVTKYRRNNYKYTAEDLKSSYTTSDRLFLPLDKPLDAAATLKDLELKTEQGNVIKNLLYFVTDATTSNKSEELNTFSIYGNHEKLRRYLFFDHTAFLEAIKELEDTSTSFNVRFPAAMVKSVGAWGNDVADEVAERNKRCINRCRVFNWYNSRLFVAGCGEFPNADWYSELNEPTYFKDINYTEIGNDDSRIMGYLPVGEQQAVIKSDSIQLQDASVYLRRAEWDEEQGYYFPLSRGVIGIGAVGEGGFATLVDDRMYLSKDGVMGIVTENITGERVIQQRSTRVNSRLLKEEGLEKAVCCVWRGYLLCAVNGNVYVADSRQKSYARNAASNFEYEWYFWQGIPVSCMRVRDDALFLGTSDGKLGRLNTDLSGSEQWSDWPDGLAGEPAGIAAVWATRFDDDGDFMVKKNMRRRGCGVFLKGAGEGSVRVQVRTEREYLKDLAERDHGVYGSGGEFEEVTLSDLPPRPVAVNRKVKKYAVIQVVCSSDEPGHDFGVLGIERRFTRNYFVK